MSTTHSINERGFERVAVEVELKPCPLCAWPNVDALDFHEAGSESPKFAKIACGRCGCRITGGSVKYLAPRWNNRPALS